VWGGPYVNGSEVGPSRRGETPGQCGKGDMAKTPSLRKNKRGIRRGKGVRNAARVRGGTGSRRHGKSGTGTVGQGKVTVTLGWEKKRGGANGHMSSWSHCDGSGGVALGVGGWGLCGFGGVHGLKKMR